jgi:uncharacterized protein
MVMSLRGVAPRIWLEAVVFYTPADGADFPHNMIVHCHNVVTAGLARKTARGMHFWPSRALLSGLLALFASLAAPGVRADVSLYQATVPVQGPAESDRAAAFGEALKIAAVRASGRRDAGSTPAIAAAAAKPAQYVQQYSTSADRMLKVGFDARAMEQLLQQAGLPLWPAERPVTSVYLFVGTVAGGTRAVTASERPPERAELERAAQARGLALTWPIETVDLGTANARASAAGSKGAVLVGAQEGGGFAWTFGHAGQTDRDRGAASAGLGLAADTLARRYAPASTRGLTTIPVRIGGLADVRGYAGLTQYLETLSLVRSVSLRELAGDTVQLELGLRGDLELFRRIVALDGRLVPAPRGGTNSADAPDFDWQP